LGARGRRLLPLLLTPPAAAAFHQPEHRTTMARTLYCSTRGGVKDATFEEVVLGGLAPDRGLYVPQEGIPSIPATELEEVRSQS